MLNSLKLLCGFWACFDWLGLGESTVKPEERGGPGKSGIIKTPELKGTCNPVF